MDVQAIAEQARDDFDLGEFLDGGPKPTPKKVRVFTDRQAGEELGGVEPYEVRDRVTGIPKQKYRRWGIMGKIFDLRREDEEGNAEKIAELENEAKAIGARLEESALVFELRPLPPVVKKDAKRAAKAHLGIHEKVTENHPRVEEYDDEYAVQILHRMTVNLTTVRDGKTRPGISLENARALKGRLDEYEWLKIDQKMNEVLWSRTIAEDAVSDADF